MATRQEPTLPDIDDFVRQLKSDRTISIFVGEQTEPYLVPQSTLTNASDYFATHIKHSYGQSFAGSEPCVLRFPEDGDDKSAWEILLFWLVNKILPGEDEHHYGHYMRSKCSNEDLVRTWLLADKCLLPILQDSVMAELLHDSSLGRFVAYNREELSALLQNSPKGSSMRRLLEEETVQHHARHSWNGPRDTPTLANFLTRDMKLSSSLCVSLTGASEAHDLCMSIVSVSRPLNVYRFPRHDDDEWKRIKSWKEYFVLRTWPKKLYIYDSLSNTGLAPDDPAWDLSSDEKS